MIFVSVENPLTPTTSRTWCPLRLAVPPLPSGGEGKRIVNSSIELAVRVECVY